MLIFLFLIIIILVVIIASNRSKFNKALNTLTINLATVEREKKQTESKLRETEASNTELKKYQGIVDTEKVVIELLTNAQAQAQVLREEAKAELTQATAKAKETKSAATQEAANLKKGAETLLLNATTEARKIIEEANRKGEEIAGNAFRALNQVDELSRTAQAMKNIIEGYGDQYLIPTYSLLDDLAEDFAHTEAGERLKFAREKSQLMIRNGTSARCDYVETHRKVTAINFVLDAFNGKVDSILSKLKKDNYGILEQKIRDSYQLVNNNGKAFRNAVITEEYLAARIDELKWAAVVQELKWNEQEEQRRIKEHIREEEKARREYERAMREAQEDEKKLKKLIEKAQQEVAQATEEQKAMYEDKLLTLEGKLKAAEEKNQRALSMAQQTKSGNVYIISNIGSFGEDVFKIGMTRRLEPLDRVRELGDASVPFSFDVHSMIYSENAPALERQLHKAFLKLQLNKVNPRKEFFKVQLSEIKEEIDKLGLVVKWTLTAEARQYRESLVIAETIAKDKQKQLEWEQYQEQQEVMEDELESEIDEMKMA